MTTAAEAPKAGTDAVGGSPVAYALRNLLIVGVGIPLGLWLIAPGADTRPGGGYWFILVLIPALVLWPWLGFQAIGQLIGALTNQGNWRAARAAVARGDLRPDLVVRNGWATGILVIDEGARRMFLNGDTYRFDEVRRLDTASRPSPRLRFTMGRGTNPVQDVGVGSNVALQQAFARVGNVLGLS